jgi:hypothetical protein
VFLNDLKTIFGYISEWLPNVAREIIVFKLSQVEYVSADKIKNKYWLHPNNINMRLLKSQNNYVVFVLDVKFTSIGCQGDISILLPNRIGFICSLKLYA